MSEKSWYQNFSEIIRHFRTSEDQNIRLSVIFRPPDSQSVRKLYLQTLSETFRNFQTFSDYFRHSQIIRPPDDQHDRNPDCQIFSTSDHEIFSGHFSLSDSWLIRPSGILRSFQAIRLSVDQVFRHSQTIRYFQAISDHQTVGWSDLQTFSDYFRVSDSQLSRSSRHSQTIRYFQTISDYQTVSLSDLQTFSGYIRTSFHQKVREAVIKKISDYQTVST